MENLLQINNLTKLYGEKTLFKDISFVVNKNQKIAIIAKNGTGKSSLLNIITENDIPDSGEIKQKKDLSIAYLSQVPLLNPSHNVIEEILHSPNKISQLVKNYQIALQNNDSEQIQKYIEEIEHLKAWDYETKVKQILSILKIEGFYQPINQLSGGQQKRIALAKVLIEEPDLYILDEPTNHLDLKMVEWLENFLSLTKSAILMVTHDRYFLDRVCNKIIELDKGNLYKYNGNYSCYLEKREARIQIQHAEFQKTQNLLRTELDWMQRMPKARGTKAKYRIDEFYKLKEKASNIIIDKEVNINIKAARLGKKILEVEKISKSFGELIIIEKFSYNFSRFEKIGIIGENGTGKTTFLNIITQNLKSDTGSIKIGETIKYGYYKQTGLKFDNNTKVIDIVRNIAETVYLGEEIKLSVEQFLNYFLFGYEMHNQYVRKLSGGEQRRLYLVTVLMQNPNFLILDEPTNDLDIVTLNILEEYLIGFKGCVIIVSHDRYFMDKVVDHVFVFKGQGIIKDYPGNYTLFREAEKNEQKAEKKPKSKDKIKTAEKNIRIKNKLTYKEKLEYEHLDKEIEKLEEQKQILEKEISSGKLLNEELVDKSNKLGTIIKEIDKKSDRWLELSEFV